MNANIFNLLGVVILSGAIGCGIFIEICCLQEPCFLCFLQRAAMLMIAVGLYWNLMYGITIRHYAFSLLAALLGLSFSLRHMALNVCNSVIDTTFLFLSFFHRLLVCLFCFYFIK